MHLSSIKLKNKVDINLDDKSSLKKIAENKEEFENKIKSVNQIKNIAQEKKTNPETKNEIKALDKNFINSFDDLINLCSNKKEIKLKYELERNVNLVKFEKNMIEISFNDNLDKDFVKDLSSKLFEWTNERWIITFSKSKGETSIKDKQKNIKENLTKEAKNLEIYRVLLNKFPDAELLDVKFENDEDNND